MRYLSFAGYLAIPLAYLSHYLAATESLGSRSRRSHWPGSGRFRWRRLMGDATEQLGEHAGPTLGWAGECDVWQRSGTDHWFYGVVPGLNDIVRASLTGSILGNLLLVSGAAMVAGGWNREKQTFSRAAAEVNAGMLVMAVAAMLFPAIYHITYRFEGHEFLHGRRVSLGTSVILLIVYGLGLLFTLRTHAHLFTRAGRERRGYQARLSRRVRRNLERAQSLIVLLIASIVIGFISELLVGSAKAMADDLGWNHIFVGVILLAIIGNAAEHSTAILLARRNDMDTAMSITYQSSLQIALFAVPVLVLASGVMAHLHMGQTQYLDMVFSPMEVVAVILSVTIVVVLNMDGQCNWLRGPFCWPFMRFLAWPSFISPPATQPR